MEKNLSDPSDTLLILVSSMLYKLRCDSNGTPQDDAIYCVVHAMVWYAVAFYGSECIWKTQRPQIDRKYVAFFQRSCETFYRGVHTHRIRRLNGIGNEKVQAAVNYKTEQVKLRTMHEYIILQSCVQGVNP